MVKMVVQSNLVIGLHFDKNFLVESEKRTFLNQVNVLLIHVSLDSITS